MLLSLHAAQRCVKLDGMSDVVQVERACEAGPPRIPVYHETILDRADRRKRMN